MKIVCTASLLQAREAFSSLGKVEILPDREIRREHLLDAQALVIRSKTHVTADLLEDTPVEFVGTATAGSDHMDTSWLSRSGRVWTASPGCNANSVAEYVMTAVSLLARKRAALLAGRTLGIIGIGQVGSRVAEKAPLLGLRILCNDPPLALRKDRTDLLPLDDVLARSDILTLHTPLNKDGPFPTRHLADCRLFDRLRPGAWFLNTSRGGVTDSDSLLCALRHELVTACGLDVWENEPAMSDDLRKSVNLLTPHIAGYSLEGLLNGTLHCYRELCHYLEVKPTWTPDVRQLPEPPCFTIDAAHRSDEEALTDLLAQACPIPHDHREWRAEMNTADPAELRRRFDRFRKNHTGRREFSVVRVHFEHASDSLVERAAALGFQVCTEPA